MNDEKIRLPDFLIADLYKNSLVNLNYGKEEPPSKKIADGVAVNISTGFAPDKITILGENNKNVVILVDETQAAFLPDDDLSFLTSILRACHLNLADIAIINTSNKNITYEKIKEQLLPKNLLLFDVEPSAIKLPFLVPAFQLQKFDSCTIMVAPRLSSLNTPTAEGKLLKTKLWLSLKKVFSIA